MDVEDSVAARALRLYGVNKAWKLLATARPGDGGTHSEKSSLQLLCTVDILGHRLIRICARRNGFGL
jgi:hypothetical protein